MNTLDVLVKARGYVERGWCQGNLAMDHRGMAVPVEDPQACQWCAMGAVCAVQRGENGELLRLAVGALKYAANVRYLTDFNDAPGRTQAEVLALFDKAIEKAKEVRP